MLAPALLTAVLVFQAVPSTKAPAKAAPPAAKTAPATPPTPEVATPKAAPPPAAAAPVAPPPAAALPLAEPGVQQKVAVSDFQAPAGQEALGVMLSGIVGHELERLELFRVTTSEQVRGLLSLDRQRALLGCDEDCGSSAQNAASMLGVDLLVTGRLTKLGAATGKAGLLTLDLTLLDARSGARLNGAMVQAPSESEIVGKVPETVVSLVGKVLAGKQGFLAVQSSEAGASVKIDNVVVGTTPLDGRLTLAGGPHLLRLEKDSFVATQKQVRITPDQTTTESVTMVPSPDFIQAYESREGRFRLGTWVAGGVAVAGLAGFVVMQMQADQLYTGSTAKPGFTYYQRQLLAGTEAGPNGEDYRAAAAKLKTQVETAQTISYVAGGLGLAAGIAGVSFAIISDDPGKYRQYRAATATKVSAWVAPTGNGLLLGGAF